MKNEKKETKEGQKSNEKKLTTAEKKKLLRKNVNKVIDCRKKQIELIEELFIKRLKDDIELGKNVLTGQNNSADFVNKSLKTTEQMNKLMKSLGDKLEEEKGVKNKKSDDLLLDVLFQSCGVNNTIDNACHRDYEEACEYLKEKGLLEKKNDRIYILKNKGGNYGKRTC